jgi:hypothetical protein
VDRDYQCIVDGARPTIIEIDPRRARPAEACVVARGFVPIVVEMEELDQRPFVERQLRDGVGHLARSVTRRDGGSL